MNKGPFTSGEMFLVGWRETHNGGFVAQFVVDSDLEERIRRGTVAKGKIAGQRYAVALTELGADEKPVPVPATQLTVPVDESLKPASESGKKSQSHFPGGLCGLAVRWCKDMHFQAWIDEAVPNTFETMSEEHAIELVKKVCVIDSRKELDDPLSSAGHVFREKILEPYAAQRKEDGVDG